MNGNGSAAAPAAAAAAAPAPAPAPALWRDLLRRLLLPLLLIVAATGALGLYAAQTLTDRTFDHWLIDAARSLAHQVHFVDGQARVDLDSNAEAVLAYDMVDSTYYSVRQDERHVAGHRDIPGWGRGAARYGDAQVFDAMFAGRPVRVAEVTVTGAGTTAQVLVAETLAKRRGVRADLQLMLLPLAGLLLAAAAAIMLALRWTLRPLAQIAARWNAQSHRSLQIIDKRDVPHELLPFASALNDLLTRIHQVLLRERRFAANAAHQIRTPLAGLQLGLSRAAEAPDLASARQVITELQHSTQRTARLLQQLLALGRLDPETAFDFGHAPVDLGALAHDVGALYLDTALTRKISLELVLPEAPVWAGVQAELVSEALSNLVDNALCYCPPGSQVEISVHDNPPTLTVADSGPGLADDEINSVLERFVRGRAAAVDNTPGSGLGLAIVREIADLHCATLQLQRSALGGLAVRLRFVATRAAPTEN